MAAKKFRKSKFSCPVGGFVGERCLKHRASSMNDAHVRKSHAIDRFHAWVDRSRSHGFMRPCLDFHHRMGLRVDVCPLLRSEGPNMAVTCSAHAVTHVKIHHAPPPGCWNGQWRRRGTTLKIGHPAKCVTRGCGLCNHPATVVTQHVPHPMPPPPFSGHSVRGRQPERPRIA